MPKLQLSFHGTFAFKKEDLIKIIQAASEDKGLNDSLENLMPRTGLGNRKVGPMISWSSRAGLVKNKYLTPEGKIVWQFDSRLESIITDWLMHFYLSFGDKGIEKAPDEPADWGGWTYFVYTFLPQYLTFSSNELLQHSESVFVEEKSKSLTKNFRILLRAYTEQQALASCQFIQKLEADKFQAGKAILPNPYLIGYFLAKLWERDFGEQTSVLTESILEQKMGLAPVLGIVLSELQEHLNALEAYGIIEQRRTVPPFQVVRRWDNPINLLEKAYANN